MTSVHGQPRELSAALQVLMSRRRASHPRSPATHRATRMNEHAATPSVNPGTPTRRHSPTTPPSFKRTGLCRRRDGQETAAPFERVALGARGLVAGLGVLWSPLWVLGMASQDR